MRCSLIRERVYPYLDRALEPADQRQVEEHLSDCSDCREWFSKTESIDRRVRAAVRRPALPPGLASRLHVRLDEAATPARPRTTWLALAAALLVALSLGVAWVATHPRSPERQIAFSTFGRAVESYHQEQAGVPDEALEFPLERAGELEDRLTRAVGFHACVPDPSRAGARLRGGATGRLAECPTEPRVGYVRYEKDGRRITHLDLSDPGVDWPEPEIQTYESGGFVVVVARWDGAVCLFATEGLPRAESEALARGLLP